MGCLQQDSCNDNNSDFAILRFHAGPPYEVSLYDHFAVSQSYTYAHTHNVRTYVPRGFISLLSIIHLFSLCLFIYFCLLFALSIPCLVLSIPTLFLSLSCLLHLSLVYFCLFLVCFVSCLFALSIPCLVLSTPSLFLSLSCLLCLSLLYLCFLSHSCVSLSH